MFGSNHILLTLWWDDGIPLVRSYIDINNYWVHQNKKIQYFMENV